MALEHCFSIIKNKEKIEKVNIPDDFINYIKDSLFWIVSSWNGKTLKSGLPYYGEALISDEELVKFKTILEKWRGLFSLGTEEINLIVLIFCWLFMLCGIYKLPNISIRYRKRR